MFDKGQASYESTPVVGPTFDDLNSKLLGSYASAVNHPDHKRLLAARGLLTRSGEIIVAALLLFGVQPQRWLPESTVRILRYQGRERRSGARQQLLSDQRIKGPIPNLLFGARSRIAETLPTRRALATTGLFEQIPLIPEDAWR